MSSSVANENDEAAHLIEFALHAPYPNPTVGSATLAFDLATAGTVRLAVYDVLGRTVAVLVDDVRPAGQHETAFDDGSLSSGLYLVRLNVNGFVQTRQLVLLR